MRGSLRLVLFGTLVLLPVVVAAVITFVAVRLLYEDKELYVYDLSSQSAELVARNLATRLEGFRLKAELEPKATAPVLALRSTTPSDDSTAPFLVHNISDARGPRLLVRIRDKGREWAVEIRPEALLDLRGHSGPMELMVVNRQGQLLVHRDPKQLAGRSRADALIAQLKLFSPKGPRVGTREVTDGGRAVLAAFARVGEELAVLQTMDKALVGAAARPLVKSAVVAGLVVVALAVLLGVLLGRSIMRPLRLMTRQAEAIARGEFGAAIDARAPAEMSQLVQTFNAMSSALQRRQEELEQVQRQLLQAERLNAAGRMVTAIARELSDPLEQCFNLAQQTRQRLPESSSMQGLQKQIMDEANRASNILQNLSRLSSREESPAHAIEPDIVLSDVLVSARPLFEKRELKVTTDGVTQAGTVVVSPEQLRNALLDIFLYVAGRATPGGEVQVALGQTDRQVVVLDVRYPGPPSPAEQPGGGSLELAVAAAVFEEQGGTLTLATTGDGNLVTATLPASAR